MNRSVVSFLVFILLSCVFLNAQDFDGLKVYINPGHGGHDSNDRYIAATGFWESEGNLTKGLYLRDLLENSNAIIFMSRTQNRTEDDLALSVIDEDANANNVDIFHSIHSNGFNATANYTLLLYKETNGSPVDPVSRDIGTMMTNEIYKTHRTTGYYNRGDYSFLGFHLGVLNYLNYNIMHGTLSEGSFHDYVPESWRLQNIDYRKHEAIAIFRTYIDFYNLDPQPHGVVAGLARAKNQNVLYNYNYNSDLPNDKKRALNNTTVTLLPDSLVYVTDINNNGFFMFDSLTPGDYKVVFDHGEYMNDTVDVSVQANKSVFADAFLDPDTTKPPYVYDHTPVSDLTAVATHSDIEIIFSRSMNATSLDSAFTISPSSSGKIKWLKSDQIIVFTPNEAYQPSTTYTVTISDSAKSLYNVSMDNTYSFSFTTADDHVYPKVTSTYPENPQDTVLIYTEIFIGFDMEMRPSETQAAFYIEPMAEGAFKWDNSYKVLTYTPAEPLIPDTVYKVTISDSAKNYYGIHLDNEYEFTFKTKKRNQLNIVRTFPRNFNIEVYTDLNFYIEFDKPIQTSTIGNKIRLYDEEDIYIRTTKATDYYKNGKPYILFQPKKRLRNDRHYQLKIMPGIVDNSGIKMRDTLFVDFDTEKESYESGNIVSDFENLNGWQDPDSTSSTVGTDPEKTTFMLDDDKKIRGNYSGKLSYFFTEDSAGICRLYNSHKYKISSSQESEFGMWIYGDLSLNILEFWFDYQGVNNKAVVYDSISWHGWKLVKFPVENIQGNGDIYFHSIVIKQIKSGLKESELYFDDIQYDILTPVDDSLYGGGIIDNFHLSQNYPNPFNPSTIINYHLPKNTKVNISIYNLLGEKITTLIDENQKPGAYNVTWNAEGMASGLYLYRLETDTFITTKKMILLK